MSRIYHCYISGWQDVLYKGRILQVSNEKLAENTTYVVSSMLNSLRKKYKNLNLFSITQIHLYEVVGTIHRTVIMYT